MSACPICGGEPRTQCDGGAIHYLSGDYPCTGRFDADPCEVIPGTEIELPPLNLKVHADPVDLWTVEPEDEWTVEPDVAA